MQKNNIGLIVSKHYNNDSKIIFDFLSDFMTNKFYNIVYELAKKYSIKNGMSISDNYKNIFDSYMDTLVINSSEDEKVKNKLFGVFLTHLYESYKKYVNNQIIPINDFIINVNIAFLPDNYKDDSYTHNKQNLSVLFHTLIYNLSKELYLYITHNMNMVITNRISENAIILQKECIKILSTIRNDLFIKFEQQDNNVSVEFIENELITNSSLYKELEEQNNILIEQHETMKIAIVKMVQKEKSYKSKIEKLVTLIDILNKKESNKKEQNINDLFNDDTNKNIDNYSNVSTHIDNNNIVSTHIDNDSIVSTHIDNNNIVSKHIDNNDSIISTHYDNDSSVIIHNNTSDGNVAENSNINDIEYSNINNNECQENSIDKLLKDDCENNSDISKLTSDIKSELESLFS